MATEKMPAMQQEEETDSDIDIDVSTKRTKKRRRSNQNSMANDNNQENDNGNNENDNDNSNNEQENNNSIENESKENNGQCKKLSTCQRIHIRLGSVALAIVISISKEELPKFEKNNNELWDSLLEYLRDKLGAILQAQLTQIQNPKGKKSRNATYMILKNDKIVCACMMQEETDNYFLLENIGISNLKQNEYLKHSLSPWTLQVYAASKDGHLPFTDEGEIIVSQYLKPKKKF